MNDILINQLSSNIKEPTLPDTHEEVQKAINHLKKNKAPGRRFIKGPKFWA